VVLPDNLVEQFRATAIERLERIEAAWDRVLKDLDESASAIVHREVHTLKGEAGIVGFTDVNLVCHKLEDVLAVARTNGYAVDEDFDLAVNMALRFMAMLVRKRVGTNLGGFDLPGFIRHIDELLVTWRGEVTGRSRAGSAPPITKLAGGTRAPRAMRDKMAPAAVDAFIEYAMSRGPRRNRLRASWHLLRELVGIQPAVLGPQQLAKHASHAESLARELGKSVKVTVELPALEVTSEVLAAVDAATLHLVRNAVDHGIEPAAARTAAGKPAGGAIRIAAQMQGDEVTLTVSDDGRGIDFARVQAAAIERGIIGEADAARFDRERWIELLCAPGFSTRAQASAISGRGVGLDAVRAAAGELGGDVDATSQAGAGSTWCVTFRVPRVVEDCRVLRIPGLPFPIAIASTWTPTRDDAAVTDVSSALGFTEQPTGSGIALSREGGPAIAIIGEQLRESARVRRVIATPPHTIGEVVSIDSVEALLLRPERLVEP
jgi:two-component system, chemotaxis family, sensor kinase CheA